MKTILEEIQACFAPMVGQKNAIQRLTKVWAAFAMGENPQGGLLKGAAGLGKSQLLECLKRAIELAMEIRGMKGEVLLFHSSGELRRQGETWGKFMGDCLDSANGPLFVLLDEVHELFPPTVQSAKIIQMIKGLSDSKRGEVRTVSFGDEGEVTRHESEVAFYLATNFPSVLKDSEAIESRLGVIDLEAYTVAELEEIARRMAKGVKITLSDKSISMLARSSRGTARPLEKMVSAARREAVIHNKTSLNQEELIILMRENEIFPRGCTVHEVAMLQIGEKGLANKAGVALSLNIESKAVSDGIAFLQMQGLVSIQGSKYTTSQVGREFLARLKADRFTLPLA